MAKRINRNEIRPDDHILKKGFRPSQMRLDAIMLPKLKAYSDALSHQEKRTIIHHMVDETPGRFLKESNSGSYAIVEGDELHQKLGIRFSTLGVKVKRQAHKCDSNGSSPMHACPTTDMKLTTGDEDNISAPTDESDGHNYECGVLPVVSCCAVITAL